MKTSASQIATCAALALVLAVSTAFTQQSKRPVILRRVNSETVGDAKLEAAIIRAGSFEQLVNDSNNEVRYYYNRVDLNGDAAPEVLVYVFGQMVCGTGGCNAFVFQSLRGEYNLVTEFSPARNPITVSEQKTRGWHDLIMFVAGGGVLPGYYAVLSFDGTTYPDNPTVERAAPLKFRARGTAYLVGSASSKSGMILRSR